MKRSNRFIVSLGLVCLLALCGIATLLGQSDNTQISGFVRDPSGAIMPGVKITALHEVMKFERTAVTNDQGYYIITNLLPGKYTITALHRKAAATGVDQEVEVKADGAKADFTLEVK